MNISIFGQAMLRYSKVVAGNKPDFTDEDVLDFWYTALKDIPLEKLGTAIKKLCRGLHFPSIENILKECGVVEFNEDEVAREFVPKLVKYVERYGLPNESAARHDIGEQLWGIVTAIGGWSYLCNIETYEAFNHMQPQWRETAKVYLKKVKAGMPNTPLTIAEPNFSKKNLGGMLESAN